MCVSSGSGNNHKSHALANLKGCQVMCPARNLQHEEAFEICAAAFNTGPDVKEARGGTCPRAACACSEVLVCRAARAQRHRAGAGAVKV